MLFESRIFLFPLLMFWLSTNFKLQQPSLSFHTVKTFRAARTRGTSSGQPHLAQRLMALELCCIDWSIYRLHLYLQNDKNKHILGEQDIGPIFILHLE